MTDAERRQLATLYTAGQSLERIPIYHFSTHDPNYGVSPIQGAVAPQNPSATSGDQNKVNYGSGTTPTITCGSIIECENQILGEIIPVTGTSLSLHYASDRVQGRQAANSGVIPLSGATVPTPLLRIELVVRVAGRTFTQSFLPTPNQSFTFAWDGKDAYGRDAQGIQPASISIGYVYPAFYNLPPSLGASFGIPSGQPVPGNVRARQDITLWQEQVIRLGAWDA